MGASGVGGSGDRVVIKLGAESVSPEKIYVKQETNVEGGHKWTVGVKQEGVKGFFQRMRQSMKSALSFRADVKYASLSDVVKEKEFTSVSGAGVASTTHIDTALAKKPEFIPILRKAHREGMMNSFDRMMTKEAQQAMFVNECSRVQDKLGDLTINLRTANPATRDVILREISEIEKDINYLIEMKDQLTTYPDPLINALTAQLVVLKSNPKLTTQ